MKKAKKLTRVFYKYIRQSEINEVEKERKSMLNLTGHCFWDKKSALEKLDAYKNMYANDNYNDYVLKKLTVTME